MLGWLKNRKKLKEIRMNIPKEVLGMLELSSGFARNQVKGLGEKQLLKSRFICSNFCRGYLSGYFEAVVEVNKIPVLNESHLELMKVAGYSYFFSGDAGAAAAYSYTTSLVVENGKDADFIVGQRLGYSDYCQMLSEKKPAEGLARAYSTEVESWQVAN